MSESPPTSVLLPKDTRAPSLSELVRYRPPPRSQRVEHGEDEERFKPISMKMVRRLAGLMKPYWKSYVLALSCGVVCTAMEMAPPFIIGQLADQAIPSGDLNQVLYWIGLRSGAMVVLLLFSALQMGFAARTGEKVIQGLRLEFFGHLQRLSMSFFDKTKLGRIITRGTSDLNALRNPLVNGINVYPREIEEILYQFAGVQEAAVVGVADRRKGEQPVAFLVMKQGTEVEPKAILQFLRDKLADYKVPRRIHFLEALPRNATGKILKTSLRERAALLDAAEVV